MIEDDCPHEWGRSLSDPHTPRCTMCRAPFDQQAHDPIAPDADPPLRPVDDLAPVMREQPKAA